MKVRIVIVFLVLTLLVSGVGKSQVPTLYSALPMEIITGLVGKYLAMIQQYQIIISQGRNPDSAIKLRIAASVDISSEDSSGLEPLLSSVSKMAFWVNANIFSRYPSTFAVDLSGSFGDVEVLATGTKLMVVSSDEAIFSILPDISILKPVLDQVGIPDNIPISANDLQLLMPALMPILASSGMNYEGLKPTPKGMAHVVKLIPVGSDIVITLWVLDKTWDLCKVELFDTKSGDAATIIIDQLQLITFVPDLKFGIDTTTMTELPYDNLISILDLKLASVVINGVPVVADLYPSSPKLRQGEKVEIISNALDTEGKESELVPLIEYKSPDGVWTSLKAEYAGVSPQGSWKSIFAPTLITPSGSYDLRVSYTDKSGNTSEPFELLGAITVVAVPPNVVKATPVSKEKRVSVSTSIAVTFSHEMYKDSVESSFSLTDPSKMSVPGSFEWSSTSFIFKPQKDLNYGSQYIAKIAGTALGINGETLDADMDGSGEGSPKDDYEWTFTTENAPLPKIAKFSPSDKQVDVPLSTKITVEFTEPMNKTSVESAFSVTYGDGKPIAGTIQWTGKVLTFTPSQSLNYNSICKVRLTGLAKSELGAGLDTNGNGVAEGSPKDDLYFVFSAEKIPALAVELEPANVNNGVIKGSIVVANVVAENMLKLGSFTFDVNFNPAVLQILKVDQASFANWRPRPKDIGKSDVWLPVIIDNDKGKTTIAVSKTRDSGVSGTGVLATITFETIGAGRSSIDFQNASLKNILDEKINNILRDADILVVEFGLYDVNKDGVVDILDFVKSRPEGKADVNGDGVVDILDVVASIRPGQDLGLWDVNGDGIIDIRDFIKIQSDKGINPDANGDGVVDILDIVYILGGAKGTPALLVNELGVSFPNPTNPESWIPFKLAESSDVVIRIYNTKGQLVRTLDLGYRLPGKYITGATAAHWDGKDENGQHVSSGVYFYNIKAGSFTATKKLIVLE